MRKADNLPPSCAVVTKSGNLNFLETSGPLRACNVTALPFTSQRTAFSNTRAKHLLLFWKILVVDSKNHTKHTVSINFILLKGHNKWYELVTIGL